MRPILKMYLEILNRHLGAGRVQLPRAIDATDAREVHVLHALGGVFYIGDGRVGCGTYC